MNAYAKVEDVQAQGYGIIARDPGTECTSQPGQHDDKEQETEIQWHDAERSTRIEITEIAVTAFCVVKNTGDEEARQDEEKIDTGPCPTEHR